MSTLGPRGLAVLSIAGIAALGLAVLGWTQRGTGLVTPPVTAAPRTPASPATPAAAGPQLKSEPYASYAYRVWPGSLTPDGRLVTTAQGQVLP